MSTDQNKAVVRRFMTEVLAGGNLAVIDEVLAPTYMNPSTNTNRTAFRGFVASLAAGLSKREFDIDNLVAEGDAVVARFTFKAANAAGQSASCRGLTYYRLEGGKIVEDEPVVYPTMTETLAKLMPSPAQVTQP